MTRALVLSLPLVLIAGATACGAYDMGGYYAQTGGAQDIGYARDLIADGQVPPPDSITVGGLLNEHHTPIEGEAPCEDLLCIHGAAGVGRFPVDDRSDVVVQIGYDSGLNVATFERQPVNLAVVIDASGSMSQEVDDIKVALHHLLDQLEEDDRLAIITYKSSPKVILEPTLAADYEEIARSIDRIKTGGSTGMEEAVRDAYALISPFESGEVESRVMLFTDVQPNVGATEASEFQGIIQGGADEGVHLTLFGIGHQFGHGLALDISDLRGGNYYFLDSEETVQTIFDEDFDFMVTPLAFDMVVDVVTETPFVDAYNMQGVEEGEESVRLEVATLFLSRQGGATVVRLEQPEVMEPGDLLASLDLAYVDAATGETVEDAFSVDFEGGEGHGDDLFAQPGTRKAAALSNMALAMIDLCEAYFDQDAEGSRATYEEVRDRLAAEAETLEDDDLGAEVELMDALAANAGL